MAQKVDPASLRAEFGANEWLVDELYQQYQRDPSSVDSAWWDFFEGYRPMTPEGQASEARKAGAGAAGTPTPAGGAPAVANGHAAPTSALATAPAAAPTATPTAAPTPAVTSGPQTPSASSTSSTPSVPSVAPVAAVASVSS
ncbi:MAG TPA: multifunctional oxoglutarate decarboxylase/oxoglutarate dehydrogenase thiamine pyrophosphate-binding subunit/dihydrolipoyllysine-residue succinyltransferase subunit, partial [Cellulomonas sp.]